VRSAPLAARSKAYVCGRSPAEIVVFESHGGGGPFLCCECYVLSGRGLWQELITHPDESYRLWCVVVWSINLKNEIAISLVRAKRHKKCQCEVSSLHLHYSNASDVNSELKVPSSNLGRHISNSKVHCGLPQSLQTNVNDRFLPHILNY
jgi:hypothetical protein